MSGNNDLSGGVGGYPLPPTHLEQKPPLLQGLPILLRMYKICHALARDAACSHPHLPLAGLGCLENALLHKSLLAECLRAEVLPFVFLLLSRRLHLLHLFQFLFLLLLQILLLFDVHFLEKVYRNLKRRRYRYQYTVLRIRIRFGDGKKIRILEPVPGINIPDHFTKSLVKI
jgi:hypothetical protein